MLTFDNLAGMNIHYLFFSLEEFLDYQQKIGVTAIELWGGAPHFYMDPNSYSNPTTIRKKVEERGQKIIAFTPESITYPYNIAAPESMQWEKSKGYFSNAIKVTAELGAEIMTLNSGYGLEQEPVSEAWKRSKEMLSFLAEESEKNGVTLALEALRPEESKIVTKLADVELMLLEVGSLRLQGMVDFTAMSVANETLTDWFETLGSKIIHTHFIDAKKTGGHLAWGDGELNLMESIATLNNYGYKGYLGQEITEFDYFTKPYEADRQVAKLFSEALNKQ